MAAMEAGGSFDRPTPGPYYVYSEHFVVHYATTGQHATTRAYAESVRVYAEYSRRIQVDSLKWAAAPLDGTAGGDSKYDIYINEMGDTLGVTYPESDCPVPYPAGRTSYIRLKRNIDDWGLLRVTVAHEFNHACQFRYNAQGGQVGIWWYENTATWMENVCFDEVDDYVNYLYTSPSPLTRPDQAINTTTDLYLYAGAIWPMFLQEYYSIGCPRRCWERIGVRGTQASALADADWTLSSTYLASMDEALAEYAIWRYFTGSRSDVGHFFSESELWPPSEVLRTHSSLPASGDHGARPPSGPGGANYIEFTSGTDVLCAEFDGQDGADWSACLIAVRSQAQPVVSDFLLDANQRGTENVSWTGSSRIVLVPTVTQWNPPVSGRTHSYSATRVVATEWTQATANAEWGVRNGLGSLVFDDKLWVLGGGCEPAVYFYNDVWYSANGASWTRATASAGWSERAYHAPLVFGNKMWVLGGEAWPGYYNDVWCSTNGTNWTQTVPEAAWSKRAYHSSVEFGGKMWILGGYTPFSTPNLLNDVWNSADGVAWQCATSSAAWSGRCSHCSVVFDGRIWILGGWDGAGGRRRRPVRRGPPPRPRFFLFHFFVGGGGGGGRSTRTTCGTPAMASTGLWRPQLRVGQEDATTLSSSTETRYG